MIEIDANQVTPTLKSLFHPGSPTGIRCFAVLEGGNSGRILTDDPERPLWAYVWERDDGTLYRGGVQCAGTLLDAVTLLRQEGVVALGFRAGDPSVKLFPPNPNACAPCLEFDRPVGSRDLSPYLGGLSSGFEVYRMDRGLLERSPHREATIHRYGSIDNFLDKGLAVCLLHGSETVCEAYADMEIMGAREIGVTTHRSYRGRGFATITCAHLIRVCDETGCSAFWDCAKLNLPSAALARRLGFVHEREYRLLAWFPRGR